ncbi:hypothetical protein [Bacillus alkalicellulosilyticus]|uniref:hypothetical protein n=1 Tax=Alkalihalobacterium alkalicellulosilyticum TaxID=1912214 RepID=UPI0009964181|nr:hypothetical protein [Bacillus alkalicellulosilyticus]
MTIDIFTVSKICISLGIISLFLLLVAKWFQIVELPNVVPIFLLLASLTVLLFVINKVGMES